MATYNRKAVKEYTSACHQLVSMHLPGSLAIEELKSSVQQVIIVAFIIFTIASSIIIVAFVIVIILLRMNCCRLAGKLWDRAVIRVQKCRL